MRQKTILFDLDGTIMDSGPGIINSARYSLAQFGIKDVCEEEMRKFVGPPLQLSFVRLGVPKDQIDEAIRLYRSQYLIDGIYNCNVYPGMEELLQKLQAEGHQLFVATSKPEYMAKDVLNHFGLTRYFERICGAGTDNFRNKKEQVIEYLLESSGVDSNIVMVGDTQYDVMGAAIHQIPAIGVTWGYGTRQSIADAGPAAIANTMEELYHFIHSI